MVILSYSFPSGTTNDGNKHNLIASSSIHIGIIKNKNLKLVISDSTSTDIINDWSTY
jgi:hypothetical protein